VIFKSSGEEIKNINISVNINPDISLLNVSELGLKIDKIKNSKTNLKKLNFQMPELKNLHQSAQKLDEIINDIDKELENVVSNNYQNLQIYGLYLIRGIVGYLVIHTIITKIKLYCRRGGESREMVTKTRGRGLHRNNII